MADAYVGLLPDGTGKKADVLEHTRSDGVTVVETQKIVPTDSAGEVLAAPPWDELLELNREQVRLLTLILATLDTDADYEGEI